MKSERPAWWDRTDYCLITLTQDGESHRHYFDDYDEMGYNITFCAFSPNIIQARAMVKIGNKWKTAIKIG